MNSDIYNTLINELGEIIYVSDPQTYELLFVNDYAKSLLVSPDYAGRKCYEMLQGLNEPCSFCTNNLLKKEEFLIWEHYNPMMEKHFSLRDKLVDWEGKPARMEIAIDVTDLENMNRDVKKKLETERALVACIRSLTAAANLDEAMDAVLLAIGGFYKSDRAYILELDQLSNLCSNTYEWCAQGVTSKKDSLQDVPVQTLPFWFDAMNRQSIILADITDLEKEFPLEYDRMMYHHIERLMAVPFYMEEKGIGYLGIDNPHVNSNDPSLLQSLTYFIVSEMYKRRMHTTLQYQSRHDSLTGLYNRLQYTEDLNRIELESLSSIGVVFCDINGLKHTNDSRGHSYGDLIITQTAYALRQSFPQGQIYRLSGDEFVALCPDVSHTFFMKMIFDTQENFKNSGTDVSIGYTWADSDIDILLLVRHADERMYINKQNYYKNIAPADTRHRSTILNTLLSGLSSGEYEMYLQPKADIQSRNIIGAEALVRYRDPQKGIILPDKFIPLLESEKVIKHLDLFIFEEACKTLTSWQERGLPLIPISVNFSRITILESGLIDELAVINSRYSVSRQLIEIEITETVGDIERQMIAEIGASLKAEGFPLSLDDFGTRYSSMSMLTVMEPDILKLDRSLIRDLVSNPKTRILVRRLIELCEDLNIKSIAEGVETFDQLLLLDELHCNLAQGYLFGRPIPLSDFEQQFLINRP